MNETLVSSAQVAPVSRKVLWVGYILSALPVVMLLMSGIMKLIKPPFVAEGFKHLGIPESLSLGWEYSN